MNTTITELLKYSSHIAESTSRDFAEKELLCGSATECHADHIQQLNTRDGLHMHHTGWHACSVWYNDSSLGRYWAKPAVCCKYVHAAVEAAVDRGPRCRAAQSSPDENELVCMVMGVARRAGSDLQKRITVLQKPAAVVVVGGREDKSSEKPHSAPPPSPSPSLAPSDSVAGLVVRHELPLLWWSVTVSERLT
jgi:hypothetical protein